MIQTCFLAGLFCLEVRTMAKFKPTRFMEEDSKYNKKAADYAVSFIECLSHTKGTWAGKKFELLDWQEQIIRDLFGILKSNGYRQFNTAYIEIPKKNGKSELAAAVALLLTCGDGEERAEVYGCAADRQQAAIVFDVAADMVRMCPALSKRVKILASQKRIVYLPTNSFYQVLSAEAYSKHGFNIHGVVFDELHTQPNRKLFDVMTKGSGDARMQPLYFLITTAGTDTNSICYEVHQRQRIFWRAESMIRLSIRSFTVQMNLRTGLIRRFGKRQIQVWIRPSAWIRWWLRVILQRKLPVKKMRFGNCV